MNFLVGNPPPCSLGGFIQEKKQSKHSPHGPRQKILEKNGGKLGYFLIGLAVQSTGWLSTGLNSHNFPLLLWNKSIYIKERCLFVCLLVCLFVCYHLEPKLLDGSPPKLAWTSPLTLRRSSKNFFGSDPPRGGIILEKLKKWESFPYCSEWNSLNIQI